MEHKASPLARHSLPAIPAPVLFLLIYLLCRCLSHGQGLYANLGPASFSKNWGSSPQDNPYIPPTVNARQHVEPKEAAAAVPLLPSHNTLTANLSQPKVSIAGPMGPTVPGHRAVFRHGIAYAPEEAPMNVKQAIWATNTILRKPYIWGGGHDSFFAAGYDCSGTVSFALHYAGLISSPMDSRSLMSFGEPGSGKWMTVYARNGHTWMVIAGLRLDTTGFYGDEGPRWRTDGRTPWGFTARHPVGL